jgi:hypothetical protein
MSKIVSRRALLAGAAMAPVAGLGSWLALRGSSTANAQASLDERLTGLEAGGELFLPRGETPFRRPVRFSGQRLNLRGEGPNVSSVRFEPAAPAAAIELNTPAKGGQYQSSIIGLGFVSSNNIAKTAIRLVNVANVNLERIGIAGGNWEGAGSIGIHTFGRQFVRIRDCDIGCARPIVISPNAVHPSLAADFFEITSCELTSTLASGCCIELEDGVVFSNFAIRDTALVGGTDGFRFDDRSSRGASINLEFQNCRTEQGKSPNGWSFDIRSTRQSIQSILLRNVRCDIGRNGIRIRNGQRITLINVDIDQAGGRTALDIEFNPGTVLTILGGFNQVGGKTRLTNARKVIGVESAIGGGFGPVEVWVYDPAARA